MSYMYHMSDFLNKITKLQNDFYSKNPKNVLFKSQQKTNCASAVSTQMDMNTLIQNTVYIINNTNKIFIDYTIFKVYANPSNYQDIVDYVLSLFDFAIQRFGNFEVHLNLNTFTVTACQRYKKIIETFITGCLRNNTEYIKKIDKLHIYNTPTVFDNIALILNQLIHPEVKDKIVLYNKTDSNERIQCLFAVSS